MKKSRLIVSVLIAIFGIISAFVLMAEPFGNSMDTGSGFLVIFGEDNWSYNTVPLLIVAFVLEMVGVLLPFLSVFGDKKIAKIVYVSTAALFVFSGIMMLLALQLFGAANVGKAGIDGGDLSVYDGLGPAFISNAIMAFIAAAISLIGLVVVKRED